jgi:response regulator of citrate/malate metabolism
MFLWLDDIRPMPDDFTHHARSVNEAKKLIKLAEEEDEEIELISLDHDLGDYASDGGDGICLLDWLVERNTTYPVIFHTANPVGRANMQRIKDRFW